MSPRRRSALVLGMCFWFAFSSRGIAFGQEPTESGNVPRFVKFAGVLTDVQGQPRPGRLPITFAIYAEPEGEAPLWAA